MNNNTTAVRKNKIGIWMDHSRANLYDVKLNGKSKSILSNFSFDTKEEALNRSEKLMHNKRQQMHQAFYRKIGAVVLNYNDVLLFGPTNAKVELFNYLNKDLHFKGINIVTESVDNITDNEKYAFVKKHFEREK